MNNLIFALIIGISATLIMDLWGVIRKFLFDITPPNYGLVGRWIAYMPRGRFRHESIAASSPVHGEYIVGWTAHYVIGIAFAALLISIWGGEWTQHPTIGPALAVGIGTVLAPFLIMQPSMGAGIAASRTPHPLSARVQSLITHTVFGFGLYATGWAIRFFYSS
ncbi:MAG: DUF2938 domain-containing protein [Gammaproteobacteria bacterium]|nr:DUF2938 domain-containing protein [Gammaproteobacteria bacterium]